MAKTRNGVIAALDIGTSKVVCFVARVDGQGLRVVGIGHQPSMGMRSGNIVDMEAATRAISSAVSTAEEMCGEHVREVIVGVSGDDMDNPGYLQAHDPVSGEMTWRWYAVPQNPGDPGADALLRRRRHGGGLAEGGERDDAQEVLP